MFFSKKISTVLLLARSAMGANVHFGEDEPFISPLMVEDVGYGLAVWHKVCGLGNSGVVELNMLAGGVQDTYCYNNGNTAAPGQNPAESGEGSTSGSVSDGTNGCVDFVVTADAFDEGNCCYFECGADEPCSEPFKVKGQWQDPVCDVGGPCCFAEEDVDPDAPKCPDACPSCRLPEGSEDCANTKNWDQYVVGVKFNTIVIDSVLRDELEDPNDPNIREVQRLVCSFADSVDGDVAVVDSDCVTCEICRMTGQPPYCEDILGSNVAGFGDWPAIEEGCP